MSGEHTIQEFGVLVLSRRKGRNEIHTSLLAGVDRSGIALGDKVAEDFRPP